MIARMKATGMLPPESSHISPAVSQTGAHSVASLGQQSRATSSNYEGTTPQGWGESMPGPNVRSTPSSTHSLTGVRRFASPTKRNWMSDDMGVKIVGIGLLLEGQRGYGILPQVSGIEPDGGAALANVVQVGDRIETVNGAEARYMETELLARRLMGPEESEVTLGLLRRDAGKERRVTAKITRAAIPHQKRGMNIPESSFGSLDPGLNLAAVLSNMRASSSSRPPDDQNMSMDGDAQFRSVSQVGGLPPPSVQGPAFILAYPRSASTSSASGSFSPSLPAQNMGASTAQKAPENFFVHLDDRCKRSV